MATLHIYSEAQRRSQRFRGAVPCSRSGATAKCRSSPAAPPVLYFFLLRGLLTASATTTQTQSDTRPKQDAADEGELVSLQLHRQQIPLHNIGGVVHHKSAYYGQISVGSPAQAFDIVFDTGSGHLVLPSSFCAAEACRKHRRFQRKDSISGKDIDVDGTIVSPGAARDQIAVSYGTGEITGVFMQDTVCLHAGGRQAKKAPRTPRSGSSPSSLFQKGHVLREAAKEVSEVAEEGVQSGPGSGKASGCVDLRFIAATYMSEDPFSSFAFDGVMGLGLSSLSQTLAHNLVEVIAASTAAGAEEQRPRGGREMGRTFAVFLATSEAEESDITFGGFRKDHLLPPREGNVADADGLAWSEVQQPELGYWQIDVLGITANGHVLDFCTPSDPCRAVVDTGTSLLAVPTVLLPELFDHLRYPSTEPGGACDGPGPVLEFDLGDFKARLDPWDYARPEDVPEEGDEELQELGVDADDAGTREPSVEDADDDDAGAVGGAGSGSAEESGAATGAARAEAAASEEGERGPFCVPMMMEIDLPHPLSPKTIILGEPVLQHYYAVFEAGAQPRVGFGEARHRRLP